MMMPFGKYRGQALETVPWKYLCWVKAQTWLQPALRTAVEAEMTCRRTASRPARVGHHTTPVARVLSRLKGVTARMTTGYWARCPAHDDQRSSLQVTERADGSVLLYCHVGCRKTAILKAMGLTFADLFTAMPKPTPPSWDTSPASRLHRVAPAGWEDWATPPSVM